MQNLNEIKKYAEELYKHLQPYCISIYLGGSLVEGLIDNPHDIDLICFAENPTNMCHITRLIHRFLHDKNNNSTIDENVDNKYDLIQVRNIQQEEHAYGSYINTKMINLIGNSIDFKFDVIEANRDEYEHILKDAISEIKNEKRYYQIYRGLLILKHNSYEVSEEERKNLNILHDLKRGYKKLITQIQKEVKEL